MAKPVTVATEFAPSPPMTPEPMTVAISTPPSPPPTPITKRADDATISATPLARRIANTMRINLAGVKGSGVRGKIVKADLGLQPISASVTLPTSVAFAAIPAAELLPPAGVPVETVKLSAMQKIIARRLVQSKQTVPHFYRTARCQLDALLKLRRELNASLSARGIKLSVNDMLIKAMARAMLQVPDANVQFGGEELHRFSRADIAMAVAIEGGLITPVIRDAGSLSLSAIANTSTALVTRARDESRRTIRAGPPRSPILACSKSTRCSP